MPQFYRRTRPLSSPMLCEFMHLLTALLHSHRTRRVTELALLHVLVVALVTSPSRPQSLLLLSAVCPVLKSKAAAPAALWAWGSRWQTSTRCSPPSTSCAIRWGCSCPPGRRVSLQGAQLDTGFHHSRPWNRPEIVLTTSFLCPSDKDMDRQWRLLRNTVPAGDGVDGGPGAGDAAFLAVQQGAAGSVASRDDR